VERPRDDALNLIVGLREEVAALGATVTHLSSDVVELRQDVRRLDDRLFQVMLVQLATLATSLTSLVTVLVTALAV
jgi:hypothetical protein